MDSENPLFYILISITVFILVFLIGREIVCWYLKINKTIDVLEEIRDLIKYSQQVPKIEQKIEPHLGDINEKD